MKTFQEFMFIAEVAAIPMTPEQIAAAQRRKAAKAQGLVQNAGTPAEKAAAQAVAQRMGQNNIVPSSGFNTSSAAAPEVTATNAAAANPNTGTTPVQPAPQTSALATQAPAATPDSSSSRPQSAAPATQAPAATPATQAPSRLNRMGSSLNRNFKRATVLGGAYGAADSLSRGDVGGVAQNALYTAMASNRLDKGAARLGQRAVQGAATKLGLKAAGGLAARLVPGLQTAYGLYKGSEALNKGDYLGAALGYGTALPIVGTAVGLADFARDVIDDPEQRYKRIAASGVQSARQIGAQSGKYGARYGSAISGAGGPTTVNRQAGTITSGGRTAKLGSTQLIRDPKTGKQVVGDLAYRGGKAVYLARPSIASRDTGLLSRFSRWSGIGNQRALDAAAAKREYRTALANTQRYQKQIRGKK